MPSPSTRPSRTRLSLRALLALLLVASAPALAAQVPASPAAAAVVARVQGRVFDSIAMRPIQRATVRIVRADNPSVGRTATTDLAGEFRYDSVPAGSWLATFLHPVLDSLRVEPGIIRIDISEPGIIEVPLTTPSVRTMVALSCRGPVAKDMGVVVGEVRRVSDEAPLPLASVLVEWPEWVLQKGRLVTDLRRLIARADSSGRYVACGVPSGTTLRAFAWSERDTTGAIELPVSPDGYAVQDFLIGTSEQLTVRLDSAATPAPATRATTATTPTPATAGAAGATPPATPAPPVAVVRRGKAIVRGTVRTIDGRPIPNAIVRVLGSGSQVRSSAEGTFAIIDAASGTQSVEARAIGYNPERQALILREGEPASVAMRLSVQRVQLDTVRVVAGKTVVPEVRAIERRMRSGIGTILDANQVRERTSMFVTDALRNIPGVSVFQGSGYGQMVMMRSPFTGAECPASIVIDGLKAKESNNGQYVLDDYVSKNNVAAIEVYPRSNLVPPEFSTLDGGCGVVVVWTKQATGGVVPTRTGTVRP